MAILTYTNPNGATVDNATEARAVKAYGIAHHKVADVSVGIYGLTTTYFADLDLLLVAPDNATSLLLLSDLRGGSEASSIDLMLSDTASGTLSSVPGVTVQGGTYRPLDINTSTLETASNFGLASVVISYATGGGTDFDLFNGINAEGNWNLYFRDDVVGDVTTAAQLGLTVTTDNSHLILNGDGTDQVFSIRQTSNRSGEFGMTGENDVIYDDVVSFEFIGGAGNDTVDFSGGGMGIYADLSDSQGFNGFIYSGIEAVIGTVFRDTLIGGAGDDTLSGGFGNDVFVGNAGADSLIGGDGIHDLVTYEMSQEGVVVDLIFPALQNQGASVGDSYTGIEDVTGTFYWDVLIGNTLGNVLSGLDENDYLRGFDGDDTLYGGADDDTLEGGIGRDLLDGGENFDYASYRGASGGVRASLLSTVLNSGWAAGDQYVAIEGLTGSSFADTLIGDGADNWLSGTAGNDLIFGGAGDDALFGGADNDRLEGSSGNDNLNGGDGANQLFGGNGNDTLRSSSGQDTLQGGDGNDRYIVFGAVTLDEHLTQGVDIVLSSASFVLGSGLENLTLTGALAISGTGNNLDNQITGSEANNVLDGGTGSDTLAGGAGNDTYVTDGGDSILEAATQGVDQVNSSAHVAALWANVENLLLTGSAALNATGNGMANRITGNAGNNSLSGGTGADTLIGGAGNDTFIVDGGDTVIEASNQGTDQINSSVSVTALAANVEKLLLTGTAALNGAGNSASNVITGNSGNNILGGGAGTDTLIGGAGLDSFVFNTGLGATNIDRIADFKVVDDTIQLENAVFLGLAVGRLAATAFAKNASGITTDALDRIIYETDTGKLFFDADGTGAGARLQFATLAANLQLTNADFIVI